MSQQFCPRLSEAISSKISSLDKLFRTSRNSKFQDFAAGVFHSHISYLWREVAKNLNYSSENWGFLYLKSPRMTFIKPNMDESCRVVHRSNENPSHNFFRLTSCFVCCKFFMIKNSNNLTIKPVISLSSMLCRLSSQLSHPLPPEKISSGIILFNLHANSMQQRK